MNRKWKYLGAFFAAYAPLLLYVLLIAVVKFFPLAHMWIQWLNGFASFFLIAGAVAAWVGLALLSIPESFRQFTELDQEEMEAYVSMRKTGSLAAIRNHEERIKQR